MHSILPEKVALPPSAERTAVTQSLSQLPDVMLEEGARRLGATGLIYSATFFLAFYGSSIVAGNFRPELLLGLRSLVAGASILLGLAVFALSRYRNIRIELVLNLGLVSYRQHLRHFDVAILRDLSEMA